MHFLSLHHLSMIKGIRFIPPRRLFLSQTLNPSGGGPIEPIGYSRGPVPRVFCFLCLCSFHLSLLLLHPPIPQQQQQQQQTNNSSLVSLGSRVRAYTFCLSNQCSLVGLARLMGVMSQMTRIAFRIFLGAPRGGPRQWPPGLLPYV